MYTAMLDNKLASGYCDAGVVAHRRRHMTDKQGRFAWRKLWYTVVVGVMQDS